MPCVTLITVPYLKALPLIFITLDLEHTAYMDASALAYEAFYRCIESH